MNTPVPTRPIRVLIVDDSMFMRAAIKKVLEAAPGVAVVGQAKDGREGVDKVIELEPDVVTMDFNMPRLNGAEAVREIMKTRPTPVIMFSAHTKEGARETFEALGAGAVDFVTKPGGEVSADLSSIASELADKIFAARGARPQALTPAKPPPSVGSMTWPPSGPRVAIVGVSTGGPAALSRVIPALPANCPLAMIVVQHMPAQFTAALAERLDGLSAVRVKEAADGDVPQQGLVLIAPGDKHLEIAHRGVIRLTNGVPVNGCRPAADVTMQSAATVFGHRAVGVVMTGMGKDGAAGMVAIKSVDGATLAQDEQTSVIYGMPKAAVDTGVVDAVLALDSIAPYLSRLR
jgi:two-component system chemotaxis response regulator CheB